MAEIELTIDDHQVSVTQGWTILQAARDAEIYIPALCAHPDLPSAVKTEPRQTIFQGAKSIANSGNHKQFDGCQLCVVEVEGEGTVLACITPVVENMVVHTDTPQLKELRRQKLAEILLNHPHACLICPQREGCSLTSCSTNIPEKERCCLKFNNCELRKVSEHMGVPEYTDRYIFQDIPLIVDAPLFSRNYNLCVGCLRCVSICQDVQGIGALGFVYQDGRVAVGTVAPSLKESGCKFCGACVEVCPTGALLDKIPKDEQLETLIPCHYACPAGINVPRYVQLIGEGKFVEALAVIKQDNPFPGICGRICFAPCEDACRQGEEGEPIAIRMLKRFVYERGAYEDVVTAEPTGKSVAIIGSGPAGLTAAYYLAKMGYGVTIFEALPEPGGMMRVGIPPYRLPRKVLDDEIDVVKKLGVELKTNTTIESLDLLFKDGYQAILIAVGAHQGIKMGVEGEDHDKVKECVDFLRDVNSGKPIRLGERVAVIGGGNAAIDSARTALRQGAKEVTIFYRRTVAEMPASQSEFEKAIKEGVKIEFLAAPKKVFSKNGAVTLEITRMKLGAPDASGRPRPEPTEGSEFSRDVDSVIAAIGQRPEIPEQFNLEIGRGNVIVADSETLATSREGIFAAGDAVIGPASVVEAIGAGKKVAISIDKYLGGKGVLPLEELEVKEELHRPFPVRRKEGKRPERLALSLEQVQEFGEDELGLNEEEALNEGQRCIRCDLRFHISPPIFPPEEWLEFNAQNINQVPEIEGIYQLFDEQKNIVCIKGTDKLRQELEEQLETSGARYFLYEEDPMYTRRESELLQQFLQQHGGLPSQNLGVDDDLF